MAGEEMAKLLDEKGLVADHGIQAGSVSAGPQQGIPGGHCEVQGNEGPADNVDRRGYDQVHEYLDG